MRTALALAALLGLTSLASAQTISATVIGIGPPDVGSGGDLTTRGVNATHCASSDATIRFQLQSSTGTFPRNVDVWHDGGSNTRACQEVAQRDMNPMDRTCVHLDLTDRTVTDREFEVPIAEIAAGDPESPSSNGADICTSERRSYRFFFFDTTADPFTAELGTTAYGVATVAFDAVAPAAPTVTRTSVSGSVPINLSWEAVTPDTGTTEMRYRVYSTGPCDGSSDGGAATRTLVTTSGINATSAQVDAAGGYVITSVDQSGNESTDSETICVEAVPTVGFCDVREGGCPDGCAAGSSAAHGSGSVALGFLALLALRRRKSA